MSAEPIILAEVLTKRDMFAAMAMQGLCATEHNWDEGSLANAELAVQVADALIAALSKPSQEASQP